MTLGHKILEFFGLAPPDDPEGTIKTEILRSEHRQALAEVERALEHQKRAAEHVQGIAQKQAREAEAALTSLRGMLRRTVGE